MPPLSDVLLARLAAQGLTGPLDGSPESVVGRLLAVQGQDPRGLRLAVRARSTGLTAADVDAALTRRSLVVAWLNRGTLHLVTAQDYWWLHPLTTPRLAAGSARRLAQEGVTPAQADRGVEVVMAAVTADGPQTRGQLRERLDDAGVPTARQALVHVLLAASLRADLVRGPVVGGEQAFVAAGRWLGPPPPLPDPDEALARLARRYLVGHGPAAAADLAAWAGVTLGQARRGLAGLGGLRSSGDGLVDLADRAARPAPPPPQLLGPFDPALHGWASRDALVGPHGQVVTSNGLFRATLLVGGRIVGTWGLSGTTVTLRPLEPVPPADLDALRADALDVGHFLGLTREPLVAVEPAP